MGKLLKPQNMATIFRFFLLLALWILGQEDLPVVHGQFPRQQSNLGQEILICQSMLPAAPARGKGGKIIRRRRRLKPGKTEEVLKCMMDLLQSSIKKYDQALYSLQTRQLQLTDNAAQLQMAHRLMIMMNIDQTNEKELGIMERFFQKITWKP